MAPAPVVVLPAAREAMKGFSACGATLRRGGPRGGRGRGRGHRRCATARHDLSHRPALRASLAALMSAQFANSSPQKQRSHPAAATALNLHFRVDFPRLFA